MTTHKEALAQPAVPQGHEQEPIGEVVTAGVIRWKDKYPSLGTKLYTTPPYIPTERQRTWVGLTDEEIEEIFNTSAGYCRDDFRSFAQSIEAKLKEKNT